VLVAGDGSAVAVRAPDGRLAVVKSGGDVFAVREWLAADADARSPKDHTLGDGTRCDDAGCIVRLRDGSLVAIARTIEAFDEDCRRAVLVVSAGDAPPGCAALVVDRQVWRRSGAMALRRVGEGFEIASTRPRGYERPWTRAATPGSASPDASRPRSMRVRDATPREDDLEAGD
jgi:competence protein ComEC